MSSLPSIALPLAMAAVAVVLLLGLFNMMRDGSKEKSQSLMRWRVILQAVAVAIAIIVALIASN